MRYIRVKKTRSGDWGIYQREKLLETEISKKKAQIAAKWYRNKPKMRVDYTEKDYSPRTSVKRPVSMWAMRGF